MDYSDGIGNNQTESEVMTVKLTRRAAGSMEISVCFVCGSYEDHIIGMVWISWVAVEI